MLESAMACRAQGPVLYFYSGYLNWLIIIVRYSCLYLIKIAEQQLLSITGKLDPKIQE